MVFLLMAALFTKVPPQLRAETQHFAVAVPAMEGPVTMGIFSEQGKLVRLLYRDAPVETIPSGLNGLIMTWDGKDDQGLDVPAGTYRARGMVHGPLRATQIPFFTPVAFPPIGEEKPTSPFPSDRIVLRAAEDELLDSRPLLSLRAVDQSNAITLTVQGLPLLTIPLLERVVSGKLSCGHGTRTGGAILGIENGTLREDYLISGLDRIVPMEAGELKVSANASHPPPNAGESTP